MGRRNANWNIGRRSGVKKKRKAMGAEINGSDEKR